MRAQLIVAATALLGSVLLAQETAPPQTAPAQVTSAPVAAAPVVAETLAAQIMLDRLGFSPGEIDGQPGLNFRRALQAFQRGHGVPVSDKMNPATWSRLTERVGPQPPLVSYEIVETDVSGPFAADIPADLVEQSKLPALAYRNPLEALAEKFHVKPSVLQQLNPGATFDRAGERVFVPNIAAIDPRAPLPGSRPDATIIVSKATSTLTVQDASGVLFHAPVTTGSEHDPLPIGTWKVTGVQWNPPFHYNPALFWDADPSHSKARVAPGPNNPVGIVWIDINKPHYGIHGAPEPGRIGHVQSHGCVRLTNWDAARVAQWVRPGTMVKFQ